MQHISTQTEAWKPVVGWEEYAEVSNHGQVRTLDRETLGIEGKIYRQKGKPRTLRETRTGHLMVQLSQGKRRFNALVHRLVLEAFVGPCPEGMSACHNDGDPTNNHFSNLRWDTQSSNTFDMVIHGVHNNARKETCKRGHEYEPWNLVANKRGVRQCRACHRTSVEARRNPELKSRFQEVSDANYRRFGGLGQVL